MSGHHKFSQLTDRFSEECQTEIAQKTAELKVKQPAVDPLEEQIARQLDTVFADEDSSLDPLFVKLQAHTLSEENWR